MLHCIHLIFNVYNEDWILQRAFIDKQLEQSRQFLLLADISNPDINTPSFTCFRVHSTFCLPDLSYS
jgi:hypothetical protein